MYGYIYKTTNLINGKIYIGKRALSQFDPNYKGSGKVLKLAFKKYGWSNFKVEFLASCDSLEELNATERLLIAEYQSYDRSIGYNRSEGGDWGDITVGMTPEEYQTWIDNISQALKGKISNYRWMNNSDSEIRVPPNQVDHYLSLGYNLGKLDSFKSKRSKQMQGEGNNFYGKNHSDATKAQMSESHKGLVTLHNTNDNEIRVQNELVDSYLANGWILGESDSHRNSKSVRMKSNNPMKGRKHSPDTIAKMRLANKGRDMSNRIYHNICKKCGSEFIAKSARTRYCDSCR